MADMNGTCAVRALLLDALKAERSYTHALLGHVAQVRLWHQATGLQPPQELAFKLAPPAELRALRARVLDAQKSRCP